MYTGSIWRPAPPPAPSSTRRTKQRTRRNGSGRSLSPAFIESYRRERLDGFDSAGFLADLGPDARVVVLFCVEREPAACHRSLLAERLTHDLGVKVTHLTP